MPKLSQARILIMSTYSFEQSELGTPLHALREHDATVEVATLDGNSIQG